MLHLQPHGFLLCTTTNDILLLSVQKVCQTIYFVHYVMRSIQEHDWISPLHNFTGLKFQCLSSNTKHRYDPTTILIKS